MCDISNMKNLFYLLLCVCIINACVSDASDDSSSSSTEKKMNTNDELSIAEINQRLYVDSKFNGIEGIKLSERDILNTIGVVQASRYNYVVRETSNTGINAEFYLALFEYETADNAVASVQYYLESTQASNGFWRFHDFLIPVGKYVLWLHGDCTLPKQNWNNAIEAITQTLTEVPKAVTCECNESCLYE